MNWWAITGLTMWISGLICTFIKDEEDYLIFTLVSLVLLGFAYLIIHS
jgi:hypothetical protein